MSVSRFPSVRRFAGQIAQLQESGRDSFSAPLGTLQTAYRFMQDARLAKALDGSDFSLNYLCDRRRNVRINVIVPIEYLEIWAPAVRLLFGSAIQRKMASRDAPRLHVLLDEAGQLGAFPSIRELFTFGRGARVFGLCGWQEYSQLSKSFGTHGANEIFGSAQFRIFKGVRTHETARIVSEMAGTMTLEYDGALEQSNARRMKQQALRRLLDGEDTATS
ncbi:MAG: hypothetical protein AMXMBFR7_52990 [Planctomycetota bacterium]